MMPLLYLQVAKTLLNAVSVCVLIMSNTVKGDKHEISVHVERQKCKQKSKIQLIQRQKCKQRNQKYSTNTIKKFLSV